MTTRVLCPDCLERRPSCAFVDDGPCIVCQVRKHRQGIVTTRLFEADQERKRRTRRKRLQVAAAMKANGRYQKHGPELTGLRRRPRNAG